MADPTKAVFELYNALAIVAYLFQSIETDSQWSRRVIDLVKSFPELPGFTIITLGIPAGWAKQELWHA